MLAGIACLLLTSCSKEDTPSVSPVEKKELGVSASISGTANTRSLINAFANNDRIGVFITGIGYAQNVVAYTFNGSATWVSPSDVASKILLSENVATVYGFYPADAVTGTLSNTDANTINISLSASKDFYDTNQGDYMYATSTTQTTGSSPPTYTQQATALNTANSVNLYLHHALTKLTFVVNKGEHYKGLGTLTELSLSSKTSSGIFDGGAGTMAVKDGTLVFTGGKGTSITFTGSAVINDYSITSSTTPVVYGLVAPRTDNTNITLTLTIDGKIMSVDLPAASPADRWNVGTDYTYTITVNGTDLVVSSVVILPWTEVSGGSTILD